MANKYAIIKNITEQTVSVNFPNSQIQDFTLQPYGETRLEATPEVTWEIQNGEVKYQIDKKRLIVIWTEPQVVLALADLIDCDGYGVGPDNVVRGDDPRIQALGSVPVTESFTLSASQISTTKSVTLTYTPSAGFDVTATPHDGPPQYSPVDFIVTGFVLSWDGRGLDGLLEEGDVLHVNYRRDV